MTALAAAALGGSCAVQSADVAQFAFGHPHRIAPQTIAGLASPADLRTPWVEVTGERAARIGRRYSIDKNGARRTDQAFYSALLVGDRVLIVRTPTETPEDQRTHSGKLVAMPPDVQTAIVDSLVAVVPSVEGRVVPALLDTASGTGDDLASLLCGVALLLWSAWKGKLVIERRTNPLLHPSIKALSRYGDVHAAIARIDEDLEQSQGGERVGRLTVLRFHMLDVGWYRVSVMRFVDVVWLYRKVTKRSVNFIPTGRTHEGVVHDCFGAMMATELHEATVNEFLEAVYRRAPWAMAGYDARQAEAMKPERRSQTVQTIMAARDAMIRRYTAART